jgi:two-component system OmpR family response regulator
MLRQIMNILVIEDDITTADYMQKGLIEAGHCVEVITDGQEGMIQATQNDYSIFIIDRMLPSLDGLSLVKTLRAIGVDTPVLFLTAMGGINDRVEGLEAGGDDYLVKPFAFSELLARINALVRRPPLQKVETILTVGDLELNMVERTVLRSGDVITLQPREFSLLVILMKNTGRVITKTMLLEQIWGFHFDPKTTVVETHISRIRAKLDKPYQTSLIHTVRNIGYSLHVPI